MATRTSVGSGLWSAAGTWDTGVPANNDVVVIAAGHAVEFDVNQSLFANGIAGITINGTLKLTRTPGTYYLKMTGTAITGQGMFDAGTEIDPIPLGTRHTVTGASGFKIMGNSGTGLSFSCFDAEPVIKFVRLTQVEVIGATVLHVDTSVIGDLWADGDELRIVDMLKLPATGKDVEVRYIAVGGIAADTITITAGLTAQKEIGTYVVLISRNVKFYGGSDFFQQFLTDGKIVIGGGNFGTVTAGAAAIFYRDDGMVITGGVFNSAYNFIQYSNRSNIKDCIVVATSTYGVSYDANCIFENVLFAGISAVQGTSYGSLFFDCTYMGNTSVVSAMMTGSMHLNCLFLGNSKVIIGAGTKLVNCIFSGNIYDANNVVVTAFGTTFENYATTIDAYTYLLGKFAYSESINDGGIPGKYHAWTAGGITDDQNIVVPDGFTKAMQTVLSKSNYEGYWQKEVVVGAGASVNIVMRLRKDSAMAYLPRITVHDKTTVDPLAGGTGLKTFTMTDSIDTWESDVYTYTNTGTGDVTLVIRAIGMNATGTFYSVADVEQINVDLTTAIAKIDAIKGKTDQLAFTVANQVDANALSGGTTPGDVADAVWDEAHADHVAAGSFGAKNQKVVPSETLNDYKADISGLATSVSLATVDSVVDAIKLKTDNLPADPASEATVNTRLATSGYTAPPSVSDIVTGVWSATTRTLSSFGTLIADVWGYATRTLSAFGFTVTASPDANVALIKAKTDNLPASPAAVGSAMTLTAGERTAIANEVESQIINEADAERVLTAITDKIASVNPSLDDLTLAGIASAVRTELGTELARIDAAISSRLSSAGYTSPANADVAAIKAKTDNLPNDPADQSILAALIGALPAAPSEMDIVNALKSSVFDGILTFEDSIKLYNAILFGKLDGGGTGTLKFRNPADTKDRVTVVVDLTTGDRDDITLDPT